MLVAASWRDRFVLLRLHEDLRSNHAFMMEAVGVLTRNLCTGRLDGVPLPGIEGLSLKYASADLCDSLT